jgi:hypothetical protein
MLAQEKNTYTGPALKYIELVRNQNDSRFTYR